MKTGHQQTRIFFQWSAILFACSFNLGMAANSIGFVLFLSAGALSLLHDVLTKRSAINFRGLNLSLLVFFLVIMIRELTADFQYGLGLINTYLAFLMLPIVIGSRSELLKKDTPKILMAFVLSCILNALVNIGFAVYRGILIQEGGINFWYFTYDLFTEPFGIQPIYQALFYVFGILILNQTEVFKKYRAVYYGIFFLLVLSTILSAARNAIVCMVVLVPAHLFISKQISIKGILAFAGVLLVSFVLAFQNPVIKNRILKVNRSGNFFSGTSLRENIWGSAWFAAEKDFIWGSGEKKGAELLVEQYRARGLKVPEAQNYHAHNQFLQTLLQYGMVGLITLIVVFVFPLFYTNIHGNYLGLFWGILFVITAITESVFARQWGIFSFAFFTCLFLIETNSPGNKKNVPGESGPVMKLT